MSSPDETSRVTSGVGGTSAGTAMVGGGLGIGTDTSLGKVLLLASPLTSVVVTGVVTYAQVQISRWLEKREVAAARKVLEQAASNPLLEPEEQNRFKKLLAEFEHGVVAREMERVNALGSVKAPTES